MMVYHVLNGDALYAAFSEAVIPGEVIVARECLIEGNLRGDALTDFWNGRAAYLHKVYHEAPENYYKRVVNELEKIINAHNQSEFNLWFGYDLFCRTNMWFVLSLLYHKSQEAKIFIVYPFHLSMDKIWEDFGSATADDLRKCFQLRILLNETDLLLGDDLWSAYKNSDFGKLKNLSQIHSIAFPYLEEVCQAQIDRYPTDGKKGRPERVLEEIIWSGVKDFYSVFGEFSRREGVYGFGDSQLKQLYDQIKLDNL
jgi:Domain of unknown function (DUF1835)